MRAQMVDLIQSRRSRTVAKHRFQGRNRFAAQAPAVGSGERLQLPVKVPRKIFDQQSGHSSAMIANDIGESRQTIALREFNS